MRSAVKTLNVRLAARAYEALQGLAKMRGVSMNQVVEDEILAGAEAARKARLKEAFARLASQPDEAQSVEFAIEAQRGVVLGRE